MKFYSASEMFVIRMKKFFAFLPGIIVMFAIIFALMLMFVSDEICNSICSDALAIGLTVLGGRIGYIIAMEQYRKENKKHKRQQRNSKRSA